MISGELSTKDFAKMKPEDFISPEERAKQEELEKKIISQQMMISDKIQVVSKSHKGE